jgi:penicillin-binding protein-related factor A (putative recombinase)
MQIEQGIQAAILALLRAYRIFCWKNNTAGIYVQSRNTYIPSHAPGVADILGVLPGGRFLAVEVKSPKGRVSPHQQQFIDSINQAGGMAFVAHSIDEVQEHLHDYLRPHRERDSGDIDGTTKLQRAA